MAGAVGITCPECGRDTVREAALLGSGNPIGVALLPLGLGAPAWLFGAIALMSVRVGYHQKPFGSDPLELVINALAIVVPVMFGVLVIRRRWFRRVHFWAFGAITALALGQALVVCFLWFKALG